MYCWLRLRAGTGKSTLVKFIVAALNIDPEEVAYVAYTGKAAQVLKEKGCKTATTAHKLLYIAYPKKDGSYAFFPRPSLEKEYKLIIVDEVSMLPNSLWQLLLKHKIPVIALGDPAQLPTIDPTEDNHILDTPHIFLDEIMRQAAESEIIRCSMWVREGKDIKNFPFEKKEVSIFNSEEMSMGMLSWADQILCATNDTRIYLNNNIRTSKGFGADPEIGDKIIGLRNHWSYLSNSGECALTNGLIGTIADMKFKNHYAPKFLHQGPIPYLYTSITMENGDGFDSLPIDFCALKTGKSSLTPVEQYKLSKSNRYIYPMPMEFSYGYAITTHKAQGSQWSKVLVVEENFPFKKDEHKRWLYTAVTRAIDKLVVITK